MDQIAKEALERLNSAEDKIRFDALNHILKLTDEPVDWVYEVWDDLVRKLSNENSYQRSIAIMVLCNLAKSDRENRIEAVLDKLLAHTRDEKFITSRQCIQNIWKVAAVNSQARERILGHLENQFMSCEAEKHYNLIRQDIIQAISCLYESNNDAGILARAKDLVSREKEEKYRKKYQAVLEA